MIIAALGVVFVLALYRWMAWRSDQRVTNRDAEMRQLVNDVAALAEKYGGRPRV